MLALQYTSINESRMSLADSRQQDKSGGLHKSFSKTPEGLVCKPPVSQPCEPWSYQYSDRCNRADISCTTDE